MRHGVVSDKSSVLVNLAIFLTAPFDVDRVDGGRICRERWLVGDFVLVVEIKSEIAGNEGGWFAVEIVEDGAFVSIGGMLTVLG